MLNKYEVYIYIGNKVASMLIENSEEHSRKCTKVLTGATRMKNSSGTIQNNLQLQRTGRSGVLRLEEVEDASGYERTTDSQLVDTRV